jgi:hypothetical protein
VFIAGEQLISGVNDNGDKLFTGVNETGDKVLPVSLLPTKIYCRWR